MAGKKRKRGSRSFSHTKESSDVGTANGNIAIAENPFEVKILPRKIKSGQGLDFLQQPQWNLMDETIDYRIRPRPKWDGPEWDGLKEYQKFVVSDKTFGTGDFVFIYHGNEAHGADLDGNASRDCWVARVMEIRAHSAAHVYLRVLWLYWPEELPKEGRKDYHSSSELVASNHMEIMDAMTVIDKVQVAHMTEDYTQAPVEGLFWRQKLDVLTGRLSDLRRDCSCNGFHDPEEKLIHCPTCQNWLHEACLLKEVRRQTCLGHEEDGAEVVASGADSETDPTATTSTTAPEADVIEPQTTVASQASTAPTPKSNANPSAANDLRRSQSCDSLPDATISILAGAKKRAVEAPKESKFSAQLEVKQMVDEQGRQTETATGKVFITDLRAGGDQKRREDLRCLCCGANLADTSTAGK